MDSVFMFIMGTLLGAAGVAAVFQEWLYGDDEPLYLDEIRDDLLVLRALIRTSKITDAAQQQLLDEARRNLGQRET